MKTLTLALSLGFAGLYPAFAAPQFKRHQLSDKFYAEGAAVGDFNKDGKGDVISGPWWYAGPDFSKRKAVYDTKDYPPKGYSKNFNTWAHDIDGDGWDDVIVVTFPGKEAVWYKNPAGGEGMWDKHVIANVVDNESPQFGDINGDGSPDLVCSKGGRFVYYTTKKDAPTKLWDEHLISGEKATGAKFTHGLGLGDVDGDGKIDLLEKAHWWQQPASLDSDPQWKEYRFQFSGPGGADMFAYDFDGDGDQDIYTSAAAHAYGLTWFEQAEAENGKKIWKKHVITGAKPGDSKHGVVFSQAHAAQLVDMDGDGVKDLITGKRWWAHNGKDPGGNEAAVLYWFKLVRGGKSGDADFVPHLIDNDSGIGTQFVVEDINGDKKPDIIVGNKKGTFVHLQTDGNVEKGAKAEPKAGNGAAADLFEDGDRVVLLGNTFFEREGSFGHLETALAAGLAGRNITFRNMGWSGDTVDCHARSFFGPPKEGFQRLQKNLQMVKPTLVIANYGASAAFAGEKGKAEFIKGYRRLLAMVKGTGARIVLMSPPRCETLGAPLPDMTPQNERLAHYRDAIKGVADSEGYAFVDLFGAMGTAKSAEQALTDNGMHFHEQGYATLAPTVTGLFGIEAAGPLSEGHEQLRAEIIEKNRLFFNRWRPQNETYLRGFRKHEQGNNAKELPKFDPLIEAKDKAIHALATELSK